LPTTPNFYNICEVIFKASDGYTGSFSTSQTEEAGLDKNVSSKHLKPERQAQSQIETGRLF
jgi:hypothetical protein